MNSVIELTCQPIACVGEAYGVALDVANFGETDVDVVAVHAATSMKSCSDLTVFASAQGVALPSSPGAAAKEPFALNELLIRGDRVAWEQVCEGGTLSEADAEEGEAEDGGRTAPSTRVPLNAGAGIRVKAGEARTLYLHSASAKLCLSHDRFWQSMDSEDGQVHLFGRGWTGGKAPFGEVGLFRSNRAFAGSVEVLRRGPAQ